MVLLNRRDILKLSVGSICGVTLSGCGFFKTNFIRDSAQEIMQTQQEIFERYLAENQVVEEPYPKREEDPFWVLNGDGTYTLHYKVAYGDITNIGIHYLNL